MKQFIQIQAQDNVAVALQNLSAGTVIHLADKGIILKQDIPRGHKFAVKDIAAQENIIKYGYPIGHATCDIASGDYVHTHNVKTNLSDINDYSYQPNFPAIDINEADREVQLYRRANGWHR